MNWVRQYNWSLFHTNLPHSPAPTNISPISENENLITMAIPIDKNDASGADRRIKGNLSPKLKQQLEAGMYGIMARSDVYGASIGKRVVVTEASIVPKAEEASRTEARVVCEVTVEEGSAAFSARVGFGSSRLML